MKKTIEVLEYTLPDYLGSYLVNGDSSGLNKDELTEVKEFEKELKEEGITIVSMEEDSHFRWSNDLNDIGCNCSTFIAYKY